jgi:O-antigen ligase
MKIPMKILGQSKKSGFLIIFLGLALTFLALIIFGDSTVITEQVVTLALISIIFIPFLILILFINFQPGFALLMFMLPFEDMLGAGSFGSFTRYVMILTVIGALFQSILKNRKIDILKDKIVQLVLALTVWSLLSAIWSFYPERALVVTGTYIGNFILLALVLLSSSKWLPTYWGSLIVGSVSAIILSPLIPRPSGLDNEPSRFTTGGQDPNDLCGLLIIAITVGIYALYPKIQSNIVKILFIFSILCLVIAILLTKSRTGLILLFILFTTLLSRKFYRNIPFYLLILFAISIMFLINFDIILELIDVKIAPLFARFNQLDSDEFAQARGSVWIAALEAIKQNLFLGVGSGNLPYVIDSYSELVLPRSTYNPELGLSAHNIILSVCSELGLIGLTIFSSIFFVAFKRVFLLAKKDNWGTAMSISLFLVAVVGMSLTWERKKILYILLGSISFLWKYRNNSWERTINAENN